MLSPHTLCKVLNDRIHVQKYNATFIVSEHNCLCATLNVSRETWSKSFELLWGRKASQTEIKNLQLKLFYKIYM